MNDRHQSLDSIPCSARMERFEWAHLFVLGLLGSFVFFHHLNFSLFEGEEGLYADIAREMVRTGQYIHPTHNGEPYHLKPPLFFWFLALSAHLFGESEFSLRLPGALFGVGTMALTYCLGAALFSRTAAFWAALVIPTTHIFYWYGPRVLLDSGLVFFITLGLLAFLRAYTSVAGPSWYAFGFVAMGLGAMVKGLHAFALPGFLILIFLFMQRRSGLLKVRRFWGGAVVSIVLVGIYYWFLGKEFGSRFLLGEAQEHVIAVYVPDRHSENRPFFWYLSVMWFDFFPWSVLIPSGLVLLFKERSSMKNGGPLFVFLWIVGFLLLFSVTQDKRERYLMPIVPGLGLLVGYHYQMLGSPTVFAGPPAFLCRIMLGCLGCASVALLVFAPSILYKKWSVPLDTLPLPFLFFLLIPVLVLFYALITNRVRMAFKCLASLAIGLVFAAVQFLLPAIDDATSARRAALTIRATWTDAKQPFLFYTPGPGRAFRPELLYYLDVGRKIQQIQTEDQLVREILNVGRTLVLMKKEFYTPLTSRADLAFGVPTEIRLLRRECIMVYIQPQSLVSN